MQNRILAVVVTYYPEKDLLLQNILSFINNVDKVMIWENTPLDKAKQYRFIHDNKVEYKGDGINSISHAFNNAWHYARDNGFDYLLTMDQDSQWENGFVGYLKQTIGNSEAPKGIWGPIINKVKPSPVFEETDNVITSGMLVSLDIVDKVGGWNEFFKVDSVDVEFCMRAWKKGIPVYHVNSCMLNQRYGIPKPVSFMGHEVTLRNDSPQRLFNIYKNFSIIKRMYPERKEFRKMFFSSWIRRIKWILLFENNRIQKAWAIISGLIVGTFYNLKKVN